MGKAQQRLFQGGVMARVSTIQRNDGARGWKPAGRGNDRLVDASAPTSLQRFVNDEREASKVCTSMDSRPTAFESGPASTIEHLMVETERRGIALPRVSQGG